MVYLPEAGLTPVLYIFHRDLLGPLQPHVADMASTDCGSPPEMLYFAERTVNPFLTPASFMARWAQSSYKPLTPDIKDMIEQIGAHVSVCLGAREVSIGDVLYNVEIGTVLTVHWDFAAMMFK